jgi:hypothetical protein
MPRPKDRPIVLDLSTVDTLLEELADLRRRVAEVGDQIVPEDRRDNREADMGRLLHLLTERARLLAAEANTAYWALRGEPDPRKPKPTG